MLALGTHILSDFRNIFIGQFFALHSLHIDAVWQYLMNLKNSMTNYKLVFVANTFPQIFILHALKGTFLYSRIVNTRLT